MGSHPALIPMPAGTFNASRLLCLPDCLSVYSSACLFIFPRTHPWNLRLHRPLQFAHNGSKQAQHLGLPGMMSSMRMRAKEW